MDSTYFFFSILPYLYYLQMIFATPVLLFTGLLIIWFYTSKPIKARIQAAKISWGGWLGLYHGIDDKYEYMRCEVHKLLSKLDATNEKVSDVSYQTLELLLQNKGESGCAARAALMDLDPYLWSDYQESLCDRSRSYTYSMVLALCGTILLVSGFIPFAIDIFFNAHYFYLFSIVASSTIYFLAILSYLLEYRRERIKDKFTPKVCYEPSVDSKFLKQDSKPRL
jgi:hypothetical protein